MSNKFEYIEAFHSELGHYQIICLYPLIQEYYHVHYDLTCAIANFINQYSDLCIFKIFNAESRKKYEQDGNQQEQGERQPIQAQPEQQVQQDYDNIIWDLYETNQNQVKVNNKFKILQSHMKNFKEQLFIQFSYWNIDQKVGYLKKCNKIIDYIEEKQKNIMNKNTDTQFLEEDVVKFIEQELKTNKNEQII
ncbi:unnamed protein product (macronuclear) [Paramecium tetraurelia]|uniref:Uncharacterized protein n=1 Tax=Paramecium tetraurelia TaxID=5888 RepID=A0CCJ8_PARTE|nr:uncharacterized protein GSPATT00037300001 [Paramecium tetraurelia]CAK68515.1 unnamed protein product [Paramecium tetraurelia]|eukprot:XP_001435912.1 hypothetical protein (macronuclear) [Paramecium tetraurelia strain d4-2]